MFERQISFLQFNIHIYVCQIVLQVSHNVVIRKLLDSQILVTLNQKAKGDHNRPLIDTKTLQRLVQPYLNILLYFRVEFPLKTRTLFPRDAGICIDNEGSKHPVDLARCCSHQSHVT